VGGEFTANRDFTTLANSVCEANRREIQQKLINLAAKGSLFRDNNSNPTLAVQAGEVGLLFHCSAVPVTLRSMPEGICCLELAVKVEGKQLKFCQVIVL
jgi:hypothetical protein